MSRLVCAGSIRVAMLFMVATTTTACLAQVTLEELEEAYAAPASTGGCQRAGSADGMLRDPPVPENRELFAPEGSKLLESDDDRDRCTGLALLLLARLSRAALEPRVTEQVNDAIESEELHSCGWKKVHELAWSPAPEDEPYWLYVRAMLLEYGAGGHRISQREARRLHEQAAARGFELSEEALGAMLIEGRGGEAQVARGRELIERAIDRGSTSAMYYMALLHLGGHGIERDLQRSLKLCYEAAESGFYRAALFLLSRCVDDSYSDLGLDCTSRSIHLYAKWGLNAATVESQREEIERIKAEILESRSSTQD